MPLARVPEQSVEAGAGSHGPFRSDRVSSLVTDTSPWRGGTKEVGSQERDPAHLRRNPRVLIASPSAEVRRRWRHGLPTRFSAEEIAARTALEQGIKRLRPDVLLLDVALLPIDGFGAVRRWSSVTKVVLLATTLDEGEAISALRAGARGYCPRDWPPSLTRKAVAMVHKGEIWTERRIIGRLLEELDLIERQRKPSVAVPDGSLDGLTFREREIAQLIGGGARNKEISSRLNITEATVKKHLTAIFRKLKLSDRLCLGLFLAKQNRSEAVLSLLRRSG